jgi:hypothetical protein
MPQLTNTARKSGEDLYFRCPYQANVIKTFEQASITMGKSPGGMVSDIVGLVLLAMMSGINIPVL